MRYLYLAPASALLTVVLSIPLLFSIFQSAGHYSEIASDPGLLNVSKNTLLFSFISVFVELALGLAFALVLHQSFALRGTARAMALIPWALPTAVMAMSWKWIFNDVYGVANDLLIRVGLLDHGIAWLGRAETAFAALIVADVWKTTPFIAIILLAGLQSIPKDLYEAMSLDGAGPIRRFFWITLPMLRPAIALAVTFRLIQALGVFDLVWVLTGGGPADETKTIALHIYENVFRFLNPGYAAALTMVTAAGIFGIAAGVGALLRGKVRT
jgi:multiple sugar transport system permease protein